MLKVDRVYVKRATDKSAWDGRVGMVSLEIDARANEDGTRVCEFRLDGHVLPAQSVEHLMNFALQSLQDAYAGADSLDEATANWSKKRQRLLDGTLGSRDGSGGEEPWMRLVREIIRKRLTGDNAATYKAMKGDSDGRADFIDGLFGKLPEEAQAAIVAAAKEQLAEELAAKKRNAEIAGGLAFDL